MAAIQRRNQLSSSLGSAELCFINCPGLTKIGTLLSMLAMFGAYWMAYGWAFAAGLVLSIYVHEMGHVIALRRYNIAATAPMFIPFFGAFIRMKQYPASVAEDARVGLAGPIYGLAAAVVAWLAGLLTGAPIWFAIARIGAWINLSNLIPIWQLDGGRGFRALTRKQRGIGLVITFAIWALTEETMLLLICLGALYRLFSKDYAEQADNLALNEEFQFTLDVAALPHNAKRLEFFFQVAVAWRSGGEGLPPPAVVREENGLPWVFMSPVPSLASGGVTS